MATIAAPCPTCHASSHTEDEALPVTNSKSRLSHAVEFADGGEHYRRRCRSRRRRMHNFAVSQQQHLGKMGRWEALLDETTKACAHHLHHERLPCRPRTARPPPRMATIAAPCPTCHASSHTEDEAPPVTNSKSRLSHAVEVADGGEHYRRRCRSRRRQMHNFAVSQQQR
ncbi:hypothetical protein SESBI_12287 [Sesbania bispinosa]|nr:hypothetical protein SESBI_12287 [Sesbania bispinosa]